MKLFLRVIVVLSFAFTGFCLLVLGIGRQSANTVVAYTEGCDNGAGGITSTVYVADWQSGIRIALPEPAIFLPVSWSPNGQQLAYTVGRVSRYEVVAHDFKTGDTRSLNQDQRTLNMSPSWSPNGHSIAFFSGGVVGVYDTLTDQLQNFPVYIANNVYPDAWSPDGSRIAVSGYYPDKRGELYILNVLIGGVQDLSREQFDQVGYPAWSPDGRYLTFTASNYPTSAIYLADFQANTLTQLSKNDASIYVASAWSPDGQIIATTTEDSEVHLFNPQGQLIRKITFQQQLPELGGGESQVEWSPDGKYLVLALPINYQWGSYAYDLATGALHRLTPVMCGQSSVAWRPNLPA